MTEAGKPTLEFALRPHAVARDELLHRHRVVVLMVQRLLGVVPHAGSYLEIWPPAFTTYNVLVPNLFDVPRCDLGLGIGAKLRSVIAYVSSRSHGCAYCSVHTSVMGTIFRGPGGALALNQRVMSEDAATFGEAWHAAIDYAMAVGKIPSEVDDEQRAALAKHFSREDEEAVVLVATAMGFLNRCMDTLGTVLEWQMLESGTAHLSESGWHPGTFYDPEADAEIIAQDRAVGDERVGPLALVGLLRGCVAYDREALRGIPKRGGDVYALVAETLGFVPYYLERLRRDAARRAFAHMLVERLQPEGVAVPAWLKHAMCFISAKHANNPVLAAHFAFLAHRAGATREQLRAAMDREGSFEPPHASAIALAHATAEHPTAMSAELVQMLVASHSPESVIELVLVLAIEASLQRYTATYPAYRYEPPIAAFAQEHGAYLGLDTALG